MTSEYSGKFTSSSKANPCPLCDRTKDGDCRSKPGLVLCHSKIEREEVPGWQWLEKSKDGNWGVWVQSEKQQRTQAPQLKKYYVYPTRNGGHLAQVVRTDRRDGTKTFSQHHFKGAKGGFVPGLPKDVRKNIAIYRYSAVREAIGRGEHIYWVEGEQTADALWKVGIAATTSIGGTGGFRNYGDYSKDLDGATVVVCPDRDRKGVQYAEEVAKFFGASHWCRFGPSSVWREDNLPEKGGLDLYDWIEQGATEEDIRAAVRSVKPDSGFDDGFDELMQQVASVLKLSEPRKSYALSKLAKRNGIQESRLISWYFAEQNGKDTSRRFTGPEFMAMEFDEQEWFVKGLIPKSSAVLVTASPGTGKSYLSYAFARAILSGEGFDGRLSCKGKVLILQGDEGMRNSKRKFDRLHMEQYQDWEIDFGYDFTNLIDLERRIVEGGFDFVICDSYATLNRYCGFEEKDTGFANTAMELRAMADRLGPTFILIHHLNKGGTTRGTTALEANVDEVIRLTREEDRADSRRYLGWCKSRAECQDFYEIIYDEPSGELRLLDASDDDGDRDSRPATIEEKFLLLFRHNPDVWYEIDELVPTLGSTYNNLRQLLARANRQGKIDRQRRYKDPSNKRNWYYVYGIPLPLTSPPSDVTNASDDVTTTAATEASAATEPYPPREGGTTSGDIPDDVYEGYKQADDAMYGDGPLPRDRDTAELFDTSEYDDEDDDYSAPGLH